jgi:hypothetical protein
LVFREESVGFLQTKDFSWKTDAFEDEGPQKQWNHFQIRLLPWRESRFKVLRGDQ